MQSKPKPNSQDKIKSSPLINPERGVINLQANSAAGKSNNPSGQPLQPPQTQTKKSNLPLILSGLVGLILIITPLAFILKQKLTSKPEIFVQEQTTTRGVQYKVGDSCNQPDNTYLGPGICKTDEVNNWAVKQHFKCVDKKVMEYFHKDKGCCQELDGAAKGLSNCTAGAGETATPAPGGGSEADICCDGTPSCIDQKGEDWRCVRKEGTSCEGGSTCQFKPGDPAYCADDNDCAAWEVCQDNTCRSRAGCTQDSDCADGAKCVSNRCVGVKDTIECFADVNGVKVTNKTDQTLTGGQVSWFGRWCNNPDSPGFCAGTPSVETNITLKPGEVFSRSMTNSKDPEAPRCDWQSDIEVTFNGGFSCDASNHGRDPNCQVENTPTPTIPTTPGTACQQVNIAKVNDQSYSQQTIKPGDRLTFTGRGYTDINGNIDKIIFTIFKNGQKVREAEGSQPQFTIQNNKKVYTSSYVYTVPDEGFGDYSVSISVHEQTGGWFCTSGGGIDG